MLKPLALIALFTPMAACSPIMVPVVDKTGVDEAKYNQDLKECIAYGNSGFIHAGNPITNCMAERGYKILAGY